MLRPLRSTKSVLLLALVTVATAIPTHAADQPIRTFFEEVFERPFNKDLEAGYVKAAKHRAERQGDELILWQGDPSEGGTRLIFRDGMQPAIGKERVHYSYYGGTEMYDLVVEELPRQPLAIFFVEKTGVVHRFAVEDLSPYLTPSGHHLLSIGKFGDLSILGARAEGGYQDEFRCRAKPPAAVQAPEIHALTDDAIEVELTGPLGAPRLLKLRRDGRRWKVAEPVELWPGYSCN